MGRRRPRQLAHATIALLTILAPLTALAQGDSPEKDTTGPLIQLNFPPNMEVKTLVEYVSRRLKMNILYDEGDLRKRVTVACPAGIPEDSLLGLLQSILKSSGLILVEADQPGWMRIVPNRDLRTVAERIERDPNAFRQRGATAVVSQAFTLRHATTAEIERAVKPLLSSPGGNTFPIPDQGLLVVTDYAVHLRRAANVIELLDTPGDEAQIRFIPARHRAAADLVKDVSSLLADKARATPGRKEDRPVILRPEARTNRIILVSAGRDVAEVLELIESLDTPSGAETRTYRFRHVTPQRVEKLTRELMGADRASQDYKATVDEESGMLIVTAQRRVHDRIEQLAAQLDVAPEIGPEQSNIRFYKILNSTAAHVLSTIRAIDTGEVNLEQLRLGQLPGEAAPQDGTDGTPEEGEDGRFTGPAYDPAAETLQRGHAPGALPAGDADRTARGGVQAARTRDAIVTADTNTNTIIVVAPPQVQAVYKRLIALLDKRRPQVMIEVKLVTLDTSDNFSLGVDIARKTDVSGDGELLTFSAFGLSQVNADTGALTLNPGVGFNGALLGTDVADVVLKALATSGRSKVLSSPKVLTNDNATATLSSISEAPFTSINAGETVSTTSFAGYASAGTTITVTPHISEGDHLQINYSITLNSFTGEGSSSVPPPRQTNTLSSEVTIPDGHTIVIGGLTRDDTGSSESKVPFLGEIPILKHLLQSQSRNRTQSTLFAFIRPVILRDDRFEDLKYLSQRDVEKAQLPPDCPTSEPILMR